MTASTLLWIILGLLGFNYVFGEILDFLNLKSHNRSLPQEVEDQYDAEKYSRSYEYHLTNYRFSLLKGSLGFVATFLVLALGGFGWLDEVLRNFTEHTVGLALLFFGAIYIASDLLNLPFQLYHTFVIEEKFGFNKMSASTFIMDKLKGYLLTFVIGGLLIGALLWLIDLLGSDFWLWFWLFISLFLLFTTLFYSSVILPLFNKLTPLEEGDLRRDILAYAEKVSFPLDNIMVMDGSKRSTKANAFFSGLGKRKRVVLFDTLIENHSREELVAVLAHEIGHYKKKHIQVGFGLGIIQTGVMLFLLSLFVVSPELSAALGGESMGIHLNLVAFGLLFSPISTLLGVFMNFFSRKNEFEADRFAADTYRGQPLGEALIKLHQDSLSNLTPHPLYVIMNYSHPPLIQRLKALNLP